LQILVGSIMAHYYTDRTSFYGIEIDRFLPFNFLRDIHIQSPIVWIGLSWIGAAWGSGGHTYCHCRNVPPGKLPKAQPA
jgi:hypothetical protein